MLNRYRALISFCGLIAIALLFLTGCSSSDNSDKTSISSGTITGSGSSGGAAAKVVVTAGNSQIVSGGTTTITVIITDAQGRRTDATVTLTSSGMGTFNGASDVTFSGNTIGGSLIVNYTASVPTATSNTEITATVNGTNIKGSTIIGIRSTHKIIVFSGSNGTITPSGDQTVNDGSMAVFIVNPNSGFTASVSGTCGGTLVGSTYTTNPITADCTVIASFN
jgi:hypothetical protein